MSLDNSGIVELLTRYEKEAKALKDEALRITWYMRGGISYNEAMALSTAEKQIIDKIIKENFETTKRTGLPLL